MKKIYITPETEIIDIQTEEMLALSDFSISSDPADPDIEVLSNKDDGWNIEFGNHH